MYLEINYIKQLTLCYNICTSMRLCSSTIFPIAPPNAVKDFDAELDGPQSIKAKWNPPQEGAPLEGYKVSYWSRPGTTKTIEVSPEVGIADA